MMQYNDVLWGVVAHWVGNDRVHIFYRVANPSIWMYYLPDPSTNRVSFVYV